MSRTRFAIFERCRHPADTRPITPAETVPPGGQGFHVLTGDDCGPNLLDVGNRIAGICCAILDGADGRGRLELARAASVRTPRPLAAISFAPARRRFDT